MAVPYTFGTATASIPLSNLDSNFATTITLGNTAIQLGNTVTTLNNMTLANVTVSSGSVTLTNIAVTTANVTTANIGTAVITGTSTLTGLTASTALALDASKNIVSVTNTGSGNNVLATSPTITTPTISSLTSAAATALTLQSAGTTAVTVDTSQRVGIGTTSPSANLEVKGASGQNIYVSYTGGSQLRLKSDSGDSGVGTTGATPLLFLVSNAEKMRIDSSGYLLVNQTSSTTSSYVQIYGAQPALSVESTSTGGVNQIIIRNPNGTVGSISTSGSLTSYNVSSDYRLKNTIAPMTGALAKVALLKPCTYKWNVDGSDGQGFIAHELDEVVPGCVTGDKDAVDSDGNPIYQGIDTSFLIATLTAAIQELTARVAALEAK